MNRDPMKLLLIEDSALDARLLREMMVDAGLAEGVELTHVVSLEGALSKLSSLRYDCILLDLHLPDGDGVENLDRLREQDRETTIVVLTGFNDSEAALEALRRGAQEYAVKGRHEGPALLRLIRHAMERNRLLVQLHHERQGDYHRASHDTLTGLPNRQLFLDRVREGLAKPPRESLGLAICFLDLDGFKAVNDSHGHAVGDALLCEVARTLNAAVRNGDTVARLGGDEFAILLPHGHDTAVVSTVAARMVARIGAISAVDGHEVKIGASAGLAMHPAHGTSCEELLANADFAMYQAKAAGKGQCRWFAGAAVEPAAGSALNSEFDTAKLELRFQPWYDSHSSACVGVEALVRERGAERADSALQLARQHNALNRLGDWVMRQACRTWLEEYEAQRAPPRLAINIGREDLERVDFAATTLSLLAELKFPPSSLQLEVAEQVLDQAVDHGPVLTGLAELLGAGVHVAIDQFGQTPASLGRLPMLPVDVVKLDMCHVQNLCKQPATRSYLEGIVAFVTALKRELIICGVESRGDLDNLQGFSSVLLQGYGLAPPVPVTELHEHLRR